MTPEQMDVYVTVRLALRRDARIRTERAERSLATVVLTEEVVGVRTIGTRTVVRDERARDPIQRDAIALQVARKHAVQAGVAALGQWARRATVGLRP